jgi:hypothetical protein
MRVLAYEGRRLLGVRGTWVILVAALLAQVVATVLLAHRSGPDGLRMPQLARTATATVPLLPVPLAGLATGLLGALAAGQEARHAGLAASQVRYLDRLRLLLAKLAVVGAAAAVLAAVSLPLNAAVLRLARPSTARSLGIGRLAADHRVVAVLLAFASVLVVAGWMGVLTATVVRSAVVGFLLFCALPLLVEMLADTSLPDRLSEAGLPGVDQLANLARTAWAPWTDPTAVPVTVLDPVAQPIPVLGALLIPTGLLLLLCLLVQARRRSF